MNTVLFAHRAIGRTAEHIVARHDLGFVPGVVWVPILRIIRQELCNAKRAVRHTNPRARFNVDAAQDIKRFVDGMPTRVITVRITLIA